MTTPKKSERLNDTIIEVTERIGGRSAAARGEYLERTRKRKLIEPARGKLACANLAHVMAASGEDKTKLQQSVIPNIGIVTSYNDMLSAHRPFEPYPEVIRAAARVAGATAQVAGGVPAMCDGVTQGRAGMELSLFSRDVIALATAVALLARSVRRRFVVRHLRQDRAGPVHRRGLVRPDAHHLRARRADAERHGQQGQGRSAAALRRRTRHA